MVLDALSTYVERLVQQPEPKELGDGMICAISWYRCAVDIKERLEAHAKGRI